MTQFKHNFARKLAETQINFQKFPGAVLLLDHFKDYCEEVLSIDMGSFSDICHKIHLKIFLFEILIYSDIFQFF